MTEKIYMLEDGRIGMEIDLKKGKDGVYRMKEPRIAGYDLDSKPRTKDTRGSLIDIIA